MSKYVIGDIHGCSKTFNALLNKINFSDNDHIYFVGDYIDRGPDSKEVIKTLMSLDNITLHLGNHEEMMLLALDSEEPHTSEYYTNMWLRNGGRQTLKSYNDVIEKSHLAFLKNNCKYITELDKFYICHAGVDVRDPMDSHKDFYLWDRGCSPSLLKKKLICGHTPTILGEIKYMVKNENKIVVDNGCVFKNNNGYGNLIALRLDDMELFIQENIED